MAYIPKFDELKSQLMGQQQEGPVQLSSSAPDTASYSGGSDASQPNVNDTPMASLTPQRIASQSNTTAYNPIFQPLSKQQGETQQSLSGTVGKFQSEAGPSRSYEGVGGSITLGKALEAQPDLTQQNKNLQSARDLLSSEYKGPVGLASEDTTNINKQLQEQKAASQAMQSGAGISTLLQQQAPSLTAGQRKYETQLLQQDAEFQKKSRDYQKQVDTLAADAQKQQEQATKFATQRAQEEKDIAAKSKEYLQGRQTAVGQELQDTVAAKQVQEEASRKQYEQFMSTGALGDLSAIQSRADYTPTVAEGQYAAAQQWNAEQFNTGNRQLLGDAEKQYQSIMDKYADIKDVPLLDISIDKKGREKMGTVAAGAPQDRALARQKELEAAGFSTGTKTNATEGKYSNVMPMYYAEGGPEGAKWQPNDIRGYTAWHPGVSPSRENVSTEDQRRVFNSVSDLLNMADQLTAAGEPFKAATVAADIEKYITDEEAVMADRKETLTGAKKDWIKLVDKMRKKYKKAKKANAWGKIVGAIGGVLSGGLTTGMKQLGGTAAGLAGTANKVLTGGALAPLAGLTGGGTGAGEYGLMQLNKQTGMFSDPRYPVAQQEKKTTL